MHTSGPPVALALLPATAADCENAAALADLLQLPLLPLGTEPEDCEVAAIVLVVSGQHRYLLRTGRGVPGPVTVDFASAGMRYRRRAGQSELLGRAVGQSRKARLRVLDATAGLGRDAFVLASLGCEVLLCEREPVVLELLRSGLESAAGAGDSRLADTVRRMSLCAGEVRQLDAGCLTGVDVIYLDPMFPPRDKRAAVKKEMALFHDLLQAACDPADADSLLLWAVQQDVARVVVKRPPGAPPLAQRPPSHAIDGKAVRYDVYVFRAIN